MFFVKTERVVREISQINAKPSASPPPGIPPSVPFWCQANTF